jgi:transcriptional regulator with XRE-family HTH domain
MPRPGFEPGAYSLGGSRSIQLSYRGRGRVYGSREPLLVTDRTRTNVSRVNVATEQEPQTAGELIRFWRAGRRLSQLQLALDANVSTKHLSFVETGRSQPSRQLLIHLAQRLDLPMAERNRLLLAGGFAPPYLEQPYDGEVMRPLRESLSRLLEAHEPNPALIVDGLWNLIEANSAASLLWDGVDPALLEPPVNMLRLAVHPGGLPSISSMTAACNAPLIHRLKRKSREDADKALGELIDEVESYLPSEPPNGAITQPFVSMDLRTPLGEVSLFTVIATLGAPLEVTAANLAIETFLPADTLSAVRLRELAEAVDLNGSRSS